MKRLLLLLPLLAVLFAACTDEVENVVKINLNGISWEQANDDGSMAAMKSAKSSSVNTPVRFYFVRQGQSEFAKVVNMNGVSDFSVSLPTGTYTVYALCGVENGSDTPSSLSDIITLSSITDRSMPDIQLGSAQMSVSSQSAPDVNITVSHVLSKLTVNLTGVPVSVTSLKMYVRNLYDGFTMVNNGTFSQSTSAANKFKAIDVVQDATTSTTYVSDQILFPCASQTMTIAVEVRDNNGNASLYSVATTPTTKGNHLTLDLAFADLIPVSGGVTLDDWGTTTGTGILDGFGFAAGDQFFNYPVTVINAGTTDMPQVYVMSHIPITLTAGDIASANHTPDHLLTYNSIPDLQVAYWYLPQSNRRSGDVLSVIGNLTLSALNARIAETGGTVIDGSATNILAYYTVDGNGARTYYRFDFTNNTVVAVPNVTAQTQFVFYPIGRINIMQ